MDNENKKNILQMSNYVDKETERLLMELVKQAQEGRIDGVEIVVFYRNNGHGIRWAGRALRDYARALGGAADLFYTILNK